MNGTQLLDPQERLDAVLLAFDALLAATPRAGADTADVVLPEVLPEVRPDLNVLYLLHACRTQAAPARGLEPFPGVPGYEILEELGRGGMGVVYKARQTRLKRLVALKMILPGPRVTPVDLDRFRREADSVAKLQHPNIVQIFEVGESDGTPFLSLEFVEGGSLDRRLGGAPLPPVDAAGLVETLARAVLAAHRAGLIHRDLKPANILVTSGGVPKITDFGLAKQIDADPGLTATGAILGTPSYMAPEQATGESQPVGPAADIYALGGILYECLTGRPPFRGSSILETLEQVKNHDPVPPRSLRPGLPRDLETICLKCLRKQPPDRYHSAEELAVDLRNYLEGRPIHARPVGPAERCWRWCKRKPWLALFAGASAVLLVAVIAVSLWFTYRVADERGKSATANSERLNALREKESAEKQGRTEAHYRSLLANVERSLRRPPGWTWQNRDAITALAKQRFDAPERSRELRSQLVGALLHPDIREEPKLFVPLLPRVGQGTTSATAGNTLNPWLNAGAVAYSPDGRWLAVGQNICRAPAAFVHLVDPRTAEVGRSLSFPVNPFRVRPDGTTALAFSPGGRYLAAGSSSGQIHLWDLDAEPARTVSWTAHEPSLEILAFSHDEGWLYSLGGDGQIRRWAVGETAPKAPANTFRNPDAPARAFGLFTPDAGQRERLWTHGREKVQTVDAESFAPVREPVLLAGLRDCLSPDGRTLAYEDQGLIRVRDLVSGVTHTLRLPGRDQADDGLIDRLAFSPDGSMLVSASQQSRHVRCWEVASGQPVGDVVVSEGVARLAFRPDGRQLAVTGKECIHRFELAERAGERLYGLGPCPVQSFGFAPDGPGLAVITDWRGAGNRPVGELAVWDVGGRAATPTHVREIVLPAHWHVAPTFGPGEPTRIAFGTGPATAVWSLAESGVREIAQPGQLRYLRFVGPDRLWALEGELVHVWDVHTGKRLTGFDHTWTSRVTGLGGAVAVTAAEGRLLAGTGDGGVRAYDTTDPNYLTRYDVGAAAIVALAMSPGGNEFIAGDQSGGVFVMDLSGSQAIRAFERHGDAVTGVAWLGGLVITGSRDRSVRFWKPDGEPLFSVLAPGPVRQLQAEAGGTRLGILVEQERAVRVWDLKWIWEQFAVLGISDGLPPLGRGRSR